MNGVYCLWCEIPSPGNRVLWVELCSHRSWQPVDKEIAFQRQFTISPSIEHCSCEEQLSVWTSVHDQHSVYHQCKPALTLVTYVIF